MRLTGQRKIRVDWQKAGLALAFAVPAMVMLTLFIINSIFPFGDRSFLFSDMYHQYMPFFSEFMHKIKAGEGLSYSYNVGIGSNFLALYVYYLASPLHWLAFLVPQQYLMEFMSYLVIVKVGLCGLTACIYLRERFSARDLSSFLFSCFYALSGFMAAYNWNIMWLDCVILLPLILLGLERLVKEGRWKLYCVTLALSIFTNFYISIMICIFLVLYFLVLLATEKRSVKIVWNFVWCSLLAGSMAAVLLAPEVLAILETDFGDMNFPKKLESYFSVLDMLARHSLCVTTERGLEHWPNIYCGAAVMVLLPMFAVNQRIPIRRRFALLGLAGFMLVSFSTNMLDFIWHGMNYPDSLPARQSFLYIFLVLVMCYEAFRRMRETDSRRILYGYLAALIFLLFGEKFIDSEHFSIGIEFLTLAFVTIYTVLLYLYRTRESRRFHSILAFIAFVAVVSELGINTYNTSVGTTSRSAYLDELADYKALLAQLEEDTSFYRIEKFTRKTKNDGTLAGYPTASVFSSTMNSHVMDLYKSWGMRHSKVYYGFDGATAFTSALLNVKYMFGEDESQDSSLFQLIGSSGKIHLYECARTLPFGYVAPMGYDLTGGYNMNGIRLQNRMAEELGVNRALFTETEGGQEEEEIKLTAGESGYYYMEVTASGTRKLEASGDFGTRSYGDLKDGSIIYIGYLESGSTVTLTNGDDGDETPEISLDGYRMNEEALEEALAVLSENSLTDVVYDSTHVSGRLSLEKEGRLILSVPYEHGWTVLLNGEETETELFGGALMALDLQPGEYTLEMHYVPYGKYLGLAVSVAGILVFLGLILWERRQGSAGKRKNQCGAEGSGESRGSAVSGESDGDPGDD